MSWTHDLEEYVPSGSLNKGRTYFRTGAVTIQSGSPDRVSAIVKGGGTYTVVVYTDMAENAVVGSCTCPFYDDGNICKHIWAVVLSAESKGHLKQIAGMVNPYIETECEHDEEVVDEFDEDDEGDGLPSYPPYQLRTPVQRTPPATKPAAWRQHFESLLVSTTAATFTSSEGKRRVIYIADVGRSLTVRALVIQVAACRLKKDGEWGKPSFHENSIREVSKLDVSDRQILALLSGSKDASGYYATYETDSVRSLHRLNVHASDLLIPMLCGTGDFFLKPAPPPDASLLPIKWDDGAAWSLKIRMERENSTDYTIQGFLERDGREIDLVEPLLITNNLVFFTDCVARFDDKGAFQWVSVLRNAGPLKVPAGHRIEFLEQISRFSVLPPIELPDEFRIDTRPLDSAPELKIRPLEGSWMFQQRLCATVTFSYGGMRVSEKHKTSAVHDPVADRVFKRDIECETTLLNRLPELGFRPAGTWQPHHWELAPSRLPAAVRALVAEGWQVDAEGKIYRRAGNFQLNVASGVDWFEIHGTAEFEGQRVEMPQLLKAIARGEDSVRLGDGSHGLLPEEWLKRYRLVATLGKSADGQLRFERYQAGLLDALLAEQPEVTFDEGFAKVRRELSAFAGVRANREAATFGGQLREYQRDGLGWLQFLRRFGFGGCLADDMGLGKTVQVLALLDAVKPVRPSLIVAPRSLIFNWLQEAARFTPQLRVLDFTGIERLSRCSEIDNYNIVLATYGTLRRDAASLKNIHFDSVILDEAQTIKNANTESAKAARLLKADHRLALTGTPVENRLGDLWSLFEFLNPGLLGTASVFRAQIARKNGDHRTDSGQILTKALRPFLLRRTKEQVASELPAKTEQTIYCELEPEQRHLYDELRTHYRDALLGRIDKVGIDKSRMQILEALLRLRQAACHPGLIDEERAGQSSSKLDALIPQVAELAEEGHKALVFSQFTSLLGILRKRLDQEKVVYEYLDGRTRDREARVQRFQQDDRCRLFLISLKAGGLGLNLTAAEYVFLLDPWWNPAIEAQAIDRTHRIGQTRKVFAYRLIARDTVEEKILELQKTKRELADAIITADNAVLSSLSRENLELLLS
jgi:superfamily II DNA or RNA helicase